MTEERRLPEGEAPPGANEAVSKLYRPCYDVSVGPPLPYEHSDGWWEARITFRLLWGGTISLDGNSIVGPTHQPLAPHEQGIVRLIDMDKEAVIREAASAAQWMREFTIPNPAPFYVRVTAASSTGRRP